MKLAGTLEEIRLKTGGISIATKVKNFGNKVFLNPAKSGEFSIKILGSLRRAQDLLLVDG